MQTAQAIGAGPTAPGSLPGTLRPPSPASYPARATTSGHACATGAPEASPTVAATSGHAAAVGLSPHCMPAGATVAVAHANPSAAIPPTRASGTCSAKRGLRRLPTPP